MQHRIVPGRAQRALAEHERIVEAIADRDAELSEILMRRHIASARVGLIAQASV
jgi:DNA-binding GntR family transcriptional regulator